MPISPRGQIRYIGQSPGEWSLCDDCHSNWAMLILFSAEPHYRAIRTSPSFLLIFRQILNPFGVKALCKAKCYPNS